MAQERLAAEGGMKTQDGEKMGNTFFFAFVLKDLIISLTSGTGKIGQPLVKEWN